MIDFHYFIQLIMDILKIFRMQEPVSKTELLNNLEGKELRQDKDSLLRINHIKIRELEEKVRELEVKNEELEKRNQLFNSNGTENSEYHRVMKEYDEFISRIMEESEKVSEERTKLEQYSKTIAEKYEKAKIAIDQYKSNEELLKKRLREYEDQIKSLTDQYNNLRQHCQMKLTNASLELDRASKENIQQVGQLKKMLLKKEAAINELQRSHTLEKKYSNPMFKPLKGL